MKRPAVATGGEQSFRAPLYDPKPAGLDQRPWAHQPLKGFNLESAALRAALCPAAGCNVLRMPASTSRRDRKPADLAGKSDLPTNRSFRNPGFEALVSLGNDWEYMGGSSMRTCLPCHSLRHMPNMATIPLLCSAPHPAAEAAQGRKCLSSASIQATFTSDATPLGGCRVRLLMEENQNQNKNETPMNDRGGIDGCLIVAFGLFTFFLGLVLLILGMYLESVLLLIVGFFLGTLVAGFLILYPIVRLLFGRKDSVAAAIATAFVEGVITHKITKSARKKRTKY